MSERLVFIGDGKQAIWPLPFTPNGTASLIVSIREAGALERMLMPDRDYTLQGNVLVCIVAAGACLYVGQREMAATQIRSMEANQAVQTMSLAADAAFVSESEVADQLESRYQELAANLKKRAAEALEGALASIETSIKEKLELAIAQLESLYRRGQDEAWLVNAPQGQRERLLISQGCPAGSYLTIPVSYLPGTNTLQVFSSGFLMTPGADYEECGVQNEASRTIRVRNQLEPGTSLDCIVLSINTTQAAITASNQAMEAQRAAAVMLSDAQEVQARTVSIQAASDQEATLAQGWAKAAEKSAQLAYQASVNVYDQAAQISMFARRPGVCAVKDIADIHGCSPGLFIVNPHLTHAPTPFFGVWPASCIHDMAWDGVFFLGGKCYPDDPTLPPPRPERPKPELPAAGASDDWIPCDHVHPQQYDPCLACGMTNCKKCSSQS